MPIETGIDDILYSLYIYDFEVSSDSCKFALKHSRKCKQNHWLTVPCESLPKRYQIAIRCDLELDQA